MFEIGSYVSYRAEGVCVISDIREECFGTLGESAKYYILSPISDEKSTVFVPVENEALVAKMYPLLSAEDVSEMVAELKDCRLEWIEESRLRNLRFREILSEGDRKQLILLVNTVSERIAELVKQNKKIGTTDDHAIRRAKALLFEELSLTTDIESVEEIEAVLRGERCLAPQKSSACALLP